MGMETIVGVAIGTAVGVGSPLFYAALKIVPGIVHFNSNGNGRKQSASDLSPEYWDVRIQANLEKTVDNKLVPIMERQTEILERMERAQDRMVQTLGDNTMALQIMQKLQEQRSQHGGRT